MWEHPFRKTALKEYTLSTDIFHTERVMNKFIKRRNPMSIQTSKHDDEKQFLMEVLIWEDFKD